MATSTNQGLLSAYILDGLGSGKKVGWSEVLSWEPGQGFLWVHLDYTDEIAREWLIKKSGLKKNIKRALMVEESRPHAEFFSEGLLLFLRGVNLNPGHDPEDMVSIRIFAEKNRVISTRKRQLLSITDVQEAIQRNQAPKNSAELITSLAERLTNRMSDVVEKISDQLDDLEDSAEKEKVEGVRRAISELRRQSIMIRRYLSPQRDAVNRLILDQGEFFNAVDVIQLREVSDRLQRYIEELDSVRDRAAIIQEEISTRLSENINTRMYLLSLVAVIFMPLSFIVGLLGINVGGIPGAQNNHAFWIVTGFLVFLGLILVLIFRRKKWM